MLNYNGKPKNAASESDRALRAVENELSIGEEPRRGRGRPRTRIQKIVGGKPAVTKSGRPIFEKGRGTPELLEESTFRSDGHILQHAAEKRPLTDLVNTKKFEIRRFKRLAVRYAKLAECMRLLSLKGRRKLNILSRQHAQEVAWLRHQLVELEAALEDCDDSALKEQEVLHAINLKYMPTGLREAFGRDIEGKDQLEYKREQAKLFRAKKLPIIEKVFAPEIMVENPLEELKTLIQEIVEERHMLREEQKAMHELARERLDYGQALVDMKSDDPGLQAQLSRPSQITVRTSDHRVKVIKERKIASRNLIREIKALTFILETVGHE